MDEKSEKFAEKILLNAEFPRLHFGPPTGHTILFINDLKINHNNSKLFLRADDTAFNTHGLVPNVYNNH